MSLDHTSLGLECNTILAVVWDWMQNNTEWSMLMALARMNQTCTGVKAKLEVSPEVAPLLP